MAVNQHWSPVSYRLKNGTAPLVMPRLQMPFLTDFCTAHIDYHSKENPCGGSVLKIRINLISRYDKIIVNALGSLPDHFGTESLITFAGIRNNTLNSLARDKRWLI